MRGVATTVTRSSSWNQDRVELAHFEQLRKDSAISPTKRAALDREYAACSLPVARDPPPIVQGVFIQRNGTVEWNGVE